jgi:PUA domain protein
MKIKGRYFARKDTVLEIRRDLKGISDEFLRLLTDRVEIAETDKGITLILMDGEPVLFKSPEGYFPTIKGALKINADKRFVTVDKGAVPFVARGADIMRPGVVDFDRGIKEGNAVIVNEETYKKPLAIGISLWDGREFEERKIGKCVKNLLRVGDDVWNLRT